MNGKIRMQHLKRVVEVHYTVLMNEGEAEEGSKGQFPLAKAAKKGGHSQAGVQEGCRAGHQHSLPAGPFSPFSPFLPSLPSRPGRPMRPWGPGEPFAPGGPGGPGKPGMLQMYLGE